MTDKLTLKYLNVKTNYYLKAFIIGCVVSFCFFIPFIVFDNGYFLYYGDFNVQEVPFYQMVHDAFKNGEFFWNWKTDLGVNLMGSYTFYLFTSPFFWITLPFSSDAVPYLMGPLLILKFGFISLSGFVYLKRYVKNPNLAILGAMLYAFSGFSIYNIFFNHFHEAIILFPLLMAAIDKYMYEKTRGVVFLAVFASCFVNYYFFAGQVIFVILYWLVKTFSGDFKFRLREFFFLLVESILGVLATAVILIPSFLSVIQNPRTENFYEGWSALLYGKEQRYIHIIECFFFPPDIPARPNFTPDSDAKWASLGAWLPMFSMSGVIAWFQLRRKHWLKSFLILLFFMALIPILNSAFQLFNAAYYARWFYMLTLMMSLATIMALQSSKTDWNKAILWTFLISCSIALPIGLLTKRVFIDGKETKIMGLMDYPDRFWIYVAISLISLIILMFIIYMFENNKNKMIKYLTLCVALITFIYSSYIIALGKSQSYDTHDFIIPHSLQGRDKFDLPDTENCRVDIYNGMDNQAMFWQFPTIQAFHTLVPGSIMEYYPSVGVTRDVGSRPETKYYGIRALTSCRWLFDYESDENFFGTAFKNDPQMPGWSYYDTQNGFDIWQNNYFIPYGFTYDKYISKSEFDNTPMINRNLLMLKAIVLDDNQIARHSDLLSHLTNASSLDYTKDAYFNDCTARTKNSCTEFSYDKLGFSAKIDNNENKDQLVFFSVPYEGGWSAQVNNQPVDIEKVNIGFMAVRVPKEQTSYIRFNYMTPGLKLGSLISLLSILLFLLYVFVSKTNTSINISQNYRFASKEDLIIVNKIKRYNRHKH